MSSRNTYGIFKSKNARKLAITYNLDIYDKRSYIIDNDKPVKLSDVRYIVDNLWLDHFIYESDDPIIVSNNEYNTIFLNLLSKYPDLLRNCRWGYRP
jgi:hypothetical protein